MKTTRACLCGTACALRHRLATDPTAFQPSRAQRAAVSTFFVATPAATSAYLFADGRIIEEHEYAARMTSRTAQLVAIATDGFPVLVSRRHGVMEHAGREITDAEHRRISSDGP